MDADITFGAWLKRQRRMLDLTQKELARQVGCAAITIRKFEDDERRPSKELAERLATCLKLAPEEYANFITFARAEPYLEAVSPPATPPPLTPSTAQLKPPPPVRLPAFLEQTPLPEKTGPVFVARLPELAAEARHNEVALPTLNDSPMLLHNLPLQLTSFIGREQEIAEVKQLLLPRSRKTEEGPEVRTRLVTLTGSGGTGKTRLALQVAADLLSSFPDGVRLIELAPLTIPALVPQTVAATLGVREEGDQPILVRLIDYLRPKTTLLLLDNCEHLIEASAQLVEALLQACPNIYILATSRETLGIAGEMPFRVPPLSTPDPRQALPVETLIQYESVSLFVERAQTVLPGFTLAIENTPAVTQVCHRLDGVPLAIELAAARVKILRVEQIANRLDDAFRLLTGGSRTALPRQQTLRATMDWSYNLLSDPERILLRRLSVFAGGWTLEAAESVCAREGVESYEVLDLLTQLVSKSLVIAEREPGRAARYRLLEPTRQYAREKLLESGEDETVPDRHLTFYLRLAEAIEPKLKTAERLAQRKQLETEHDNFRMALGWSLAEAEAVKAEKGLRLASALLRFWHDRGHHREGLSWLEQGIALSPGSNSESIMIRAKGLYAAGFLIHFYSDIPGLTYARSLLEESIAYYRKFDLSDKGDFAYALNILATIRLYDDPTTARTLSEESVTSCRGLGPSGNWDLGVALAWKGYIAYMQEDDATARSCAEESQELLRQTGDVWEAAFPISVLGHIAVRQGNYVAALAYYEESSHLFREAEDKWAIPFIIEALGNVDRILGDYAAASVRFEESLRWWREIGNKWDSAKGLYYLGLVALFQGNYERAEALLIESLPLLQTSAGDFAVALNLVGLSEVARVHGQVVRAACLLGAAEAIVASVGSVDPNPNAIVNRAEYDRLVTSGRAQMAEAAKAAWAEGQAMTLEQAVTYALTDDKGA